MAIISFRSTEAFAYYLIAPVAMQALAKEPLTSIDKKQQGMIGTERYKESMRAQLVARGLEVTNEETSAMPPVASGMSYATSDKHADPTVGAQLWARAAVKLVIAKHTEDR